MRLFPRQGQGTACALIGLDFELFRLVERQVSEKFAQGVTGAFFQVFVQERNVGVRQYCAAGFDEIQNGRALFVAQGGCSAKEEEPGVLQAFQGVGRDEIEAQSALVAIPEQRIHAGVRVDAAAVRLGGRFGGVAVVEENAGIRKRRFDQQLREAVAQVIEVGHVLAQVFRLGKIAGMAGFPKGGVD